jgi:hypothetical protein
MVSVAADKWSMNKTAQQLYLVHRRYRDEPVREQFLSNAMRGRLTERHHGENVNLYDFPIDC